MSEWIATFHEVDNEPNKLQLSLLESGGQPYLLNSRRTASFPFTTKIEWEGRTCLIPGWKDRRWPAKAR